MHFSTCVRASFIYVTGFYDAGVCTARDEAANAKKAIGLQRFWIPRDDNVDTILQRSEFRWDTLPCLSPHDYCVFLGGSFGYMRGYLGKVCHFLGESPWETSSLAYSI